MTPLGRSPYHDLGGVADPAPSTRSTNDAMLSGARRSVLPSRDQLTYTRELLLVVLLVIAFPWLLHKLVTAPGKVLSGAGIKGGL